VSSQNIYLHKKLVVASLTWLNVNWSTPWCLKQEDAPTPWKLLVQFLSNLSEKQTNSSTAWWAHCNFPGLFYVGREPCCDSVVRGEERGDSGRQHEALPQFPVVHHRRMETTREVRAWKNRGLTCRVHSLASAESARTSRLVRRRRRSIEGPPASELETTGKNQPAGQPGDRVLPQSRCPLLGLESQEGATSINEGGMRVVNATTRHVVKRHENSCQLMIRSSCRYIYNRKLKILL
jgi:hypothetical protein